MTDYELANLAPYPLRQRIGDQTSTWIIVAGYAAVLWALLVHTEVSERISKCISKTLKMVRPAWPGIASNGSS